MGHKKQLVYALALLTIILLVVGFLNYPRKAGYIADPINPDFTVTPHQVKQDTETKQVNDNEDQDRTDVPVTQPDSTNNQVPESKPESSIVSFSNEAAKESFLAENELAESDLTQVGNRLSYEIALPLSELFVTEGVSTQPNIAYSAQITPNDPLHSEQYFSQRLALENAWDITTGQEGVVVAVIDNGFALTHEDLTSQWSINLGEFGNGKESNGIDDDNNGFIDDWRGWDFANGSGDNSPQAGTVSPEHYFVSHGTNTSGLVGSAGNNEKGIAGVSWQTKILPVQALTDSGVGYTSDVVSAVDYAVSLGVEIISMSLGSTSSDPALQAALSDASAQGVTIIAAAGNCGGTNFAEQGCSTRGQMLYPAKYTTVIAVGATDSSDIKASFSSWGDELDISAPGSGNIRTPTWSLLSDTSSYTQTAYGTSISTPLVAGVAALIKSANPEYTPEQIKSSLLNHATKVASMGCRSFTPEYGYGRADAEASLTNGDGPSLHSDCNTALKNTDFDGDGFGDIFWHRPSTPSEVAWYGSATRGSFTKQNHYVSGSYKTISGDFNGDGYSDILWYRPGTASDSMWYGTGSRGTFSKASVNINGTYKIIAGDFNGDGYDDIFLYGPGTAPDSIWYGSSTKGVFTKVKSTVKGVYNPVAGDFNGDGYDDIFWYGPGTAPDSMWYGTGTRGSFLGQTVRVKGHYRVAVNDFNGDGYADVLWHRPGKESDYIWYGTSSRGKFVSHTMAINRAYIPITSDYNGDDIGDIFWYGPGTTPDRIWYGTTTKGSFTRIETSISIDAKPVH